MSSDISIQLRPKQPEELTDEHQSIQQLDVENSHIEDTVSLRYSKLFSAGFSFFVAGTNDGSLGALLPYILSTYHIGTSFIAILYLTTFLGWLVAALTNSHLPKYLSVGALLTLGATLQIIPHCLRAWQPPFALFAITFFISGLGQAYQDSHANTFVSTVKGAHRWLGFIHSMYSLGLLVSPFVATAVATANYPSKWALFYLFPLGLSVVNLALVALSFGEDIRFIPRTANAEERGRNRSAMDEGKQLVKLGDLWRLCLFFLFYLGVSTTSGGWIVEYLVQVRKGELSKVGYVPAGSYGGLFLGRLLLVEPTHRFGERRMLLMYAVTCLVLQLVFWLVPNLVSSIVMFSIMGFFLGPFFAAGVSVASNLFPKQLQASALGMIFVVAQAGGAIFPALVGLIASKAGVQVLPPIVAGLIVAMGIAWSFVPKPATHRE